MFKVLDVSHALPAFAASVFLSFCPERLLVSRPALGTALSPCDTTHPVLSGEALTV